MSPLRAEKKQNPKNMEEQKKTEKKLLTMHRSPLLNNYVL